MLDFHPATIIGWQAFKETYPQAEVLSRETGFARAYGRNPYPGYDDVERGPFNPGDSKADTRLPAMSRVATVELAGAAFAMLEMALMPIVASANIVDLMEIVILVSFLSNPVRASTGWIKICQNMTELPVNALLFCVHIDYRRYDAH